jgi:hypothetical protein
MLAQSRCKLLLAHVRVRSHIPQFQKEVLVSIGVDGLLHCKPANGLQLPSYLGICEYRLEIVAALTADAGLEMKGRAMRSGTGPLWRWATRPLCTRYFLVNFSVQAVAVSDGSEFRNLAFWWALGTLKDGEREILGRWQASETDPLRWSSISLDLTARGVQEIRALADSSGELGCPVDFGGPACSGSGSNTHSMSAAQQRHIAEAGTQTRRVQSALSRAVLKHGAFADPKSAATFVDSELQRLDRVFWSRPDVAAQRSSLTRMTLPVAA